MSLLSVLVQFAVCVSGRWIQIHFVEVSCVDLEEQIAARMLTVIVCKCVYVGIFVNSIGLRLNNRFTFFQFVLKQYSLALMYSAPKHFLDAVITPNVHIGF